MQTFPIPANETQRLQTLLSLDLLDTEPEERFDRIIRMTARLFDVPIAAFNLVDRNRLWLKARLGWGPHEHPRTEALCAHTILQDDVFVIANPAADERFADWPVFHGASAVRFYAGVPVKAPDRSNIGTLCVADLRPRRLDAAQRALLADLAATIESEIAAGAFRRAIQVQQENEASITALLNRLPEGCLLIDEAARVLWANPAAEHLFRAETGGLVHRAAADLLISEIEPVLDRLLDGSGCQLQATGRRLDGETFSAEFSANLVQAAGSECHVVIVRDITPRRESERRDRATDERRRKYFLTATHEMRTPMASVVGFTELLLKRDFSQDSMREFVGIIHAQATRLVKLINEMLDLARIESGGTEALDIAACDAGALVADTLVGIEGLAGRADLRTKVAPGLPPVLADAAKLQQALLNVLGNAIKYSGPQRSIELAVDAVRHDGRDAIAFRVRDHGIGMSPEQQERAFDPFYRADSRGDVAGSGLGLAIVREIAELHGGSVQLESAQGIGTTVTLLIPAAR